MRLEKQRFFKRLVPVCLVVVIALLVPRIVDATVLTNWPDWEDGKRTLRVFIKNDAAFKKRVRAAINTWNTANTGNRWNLVETAHADRAEITIGTGNLPVNVTGRAYASIRTSGVSGQRIREIISVKIVIDDAGESAAYQACNILHEFGHCFRMAHTNKTADILKRGNTVVVPSANDLSEAKASDEDPPCPLEVSKNLVRGQTGVVSLTPKDGTGISFEGVENVSIAIRTGTAVSVSVFSFDSQKIMVGYHALSEASHNEVFCVSLEYPGTTKEYTGVLWVADEEAPENRLPHAVAGNDITVTDGTAILDGSGSYHDDPNIFYSGTWMVHDGGDTVYGLFDDPGYISLPPGTYTASLCVVDYYGRASFDSMSVNVKPGGTPEIGVNRPGLNYVAITSGVNTSSQDLSISNSGTGTLNWSIGDDADWLSCTPSSGTGDGSVTVTVSTSGLPTGTYTGSLSITDPNAANSPQTVPVNLTVTAAPNDQPPFGSFATPVHGSSVSGSIPVTGWALDDVEVKCVKVYNGSSYIGDAVFVEGARPDVVESYPTSPNNYRAGWGYMLLSNFLPDGGNGTYTLYAKATDVAGKEVVLGSKTIMCDNANAVKPFGAIDSPSPGGFASGSGFINSGWVLTPKPNSIPTDGSTVNVYVDGVYLGHPDYNKYRSDISGLFPGYSNNAGAAGFFGLDTTTYENGVHTIYWTATDDAGNTDGIGSRYFSIQNNSGDGARKTGTRGNPPILSEIPVDFYKPVKIIKEYRKDGEPQEMCPGDNGILNIETKELERIEIRFLQHSERIEWTGYLVVCDQLRPLPIGSTLEMEKGIFYWQPGPGFLGDFRFVFVEKYRDGNMNRKDIKITIAPKF